MKVNRYWATIAALLAAAALNCVLVLALNRHGFNEYDMSPMIDSGWRVYSGQVPGRDFLVTFPPSLYLLTALSFRVFGVTWHALGMGAAVVYGVMLALGVRISHLVRKITSEQAAVWTVCAYATAVTIPYIIMTVLWHAAIAMDFSLYGAYAIYVLTNWALLRRSIKVEALLHLTLAVAGLLLSKANMAYPALLLCVLVAARAKVPWRALVGVCAGGAILAFLALAAVRVSPAQMLGAYSGLAGRLIPRGFLLGFVTPVNSALALADSIAYIALAPVLILAIQRIRLQWAALWRQPTVLLGSGAVLISFLSMGTNRNFKLSDAALALFGVAVLALDGSVASAEMRRRVGFALTVSIFGALIMGRTRLACQTAGGWYHQGCFQTAVGDRFFGRMKSCEALPLAINEVDRMLAGHSGARVFFCPSLEFLYADRKLSSPAHMPNWWDPGTSFPLRKGGMIANDWEKDHFDLVILTADEDRDRLAPGIAQAIGDEYVRTGDTRLVHLYTRRQ